MSNILAVPGAPETEEKETPAEVTEVTEANTAAVIVEPPGEPTEIAKATPAVVEETDDEDDDEDDDDFGPKAQIKHLRKQSAGYRTKFRAATEEIKAANARIAELEAGMAEASSATTRSAIVTEFGFTPAQAKLLTGVTEETLRASAGMVAEALGVKTPPVKAAPAAPRRLAATGGNTSTDVMTQPLAEVESPF